MKEIELRNNDNKPRKLVLLETKKITAYLFEVKKYYKCISLI